MAASLQQFYPCVYRKYSGSDAFLTSSHAHFRPVLECSYQGFAHEPAREVPPKQHARFRRALVRLQRAALFQYDMTQPQGVGGACVRTKVARTLLGDAGMTYSYLGVRMFAHPWGDYEPDAGSFGMSDDADCGPQADNGAAGIGIGDSTRDGRKALSAMLAMNDAVFERTRQLEHAYFARQRAEGIGQHGRTRPTPSDRSGIGRFNLTLINRAVHRNHPSIIEAGLAEGLPAMGPDKQYKMGDTALSWHADSALYDDTSIAVYTAHGDGGYAISNSATRRRELLLPPPATCTDMQATEQSAAAVGWRVGMRVAWDTEGPLGGTAIARAYKAQLQGTAKKWQGQGPGVNRSKSRAGGMGQGKGKGRGRGKGSDVAVVDTVTPAVQIDVNDGDLYYMLGDFNHHHQHCVIAPSANAAHCPAVRYSSTHRCGLREGHCLQWVRAWCEHALRGGSIETFVFDSVTEAKLEAQRAQERKREHKRERSSSRKKRKRASSSSDVETVKRARVESCHSTFCSVLWGFEQSALTELEMSWIRPFYSQGSVHYKIHSWWHAPMASLQRLWLRLEQRTAQRLAQLEALAATAEHEAQLVRETRIECGTHDTTLGSALAAATVLRGALLKRQKARIAWASRDADSAHDDAVSRAAANAALAAADTNANGNDGTWHCRPLPCLFDAPCVGPGSAIKQAILAALRGGEILEASLRDAMRRADNVAANLKRIRDSMKPCPYWTRYGNCNKGDACRYAHSTTTSVATAENQYTCDEQADQAPKRAKYDAQQNEVDEQTKHITKNQKNGTVAAVPECTQFSELRHADASTLEDEWPFETDFGDHFETPKRAYRDIKPLLRLAAKHAGIDKASLRIYDPYYCRGRVLSRLHSLGFESVINRKRDFYVDVAEGNVPTHDVLVTNPPYSGDHKARLFAWLLERQRKAAVAGKRSLFMLLLPSWSAAKVAWRTFLWALRKINKGRHQITMDDARKATVKRANLGDTLEEGAGVFYVAPELKYEYDAAVESRQEAPFAGVWFCGGFGPDLKERAATMEALRSAAARKLERKTKKQKKSESRPQRLTHGVVVLPTLRALNDNGLGEQPREDLDDPVVRERRNEAIAALEAARKSKPRKRNYEDRAALQFVKSSASKAMDHDLLKRALALPINKRACRHYFGVAAGTSGCHRGAACRFAHELR